MPKKEKKGKGSDEDSQLLIGKYFITNLLTKFLQDYKPSDIADEFIKDRIKINSLIQEAVKLRDDYSTNFDKVYEIGEEIDYSPSEEDYNILAEIDGVLVNILRNYSQDKYSECEEQLNESIKTLEPLVKKQWIGLCNLKLNKSFNKLRKSPWAKTVNRTPIRNKLDNLKKELNKKNNPDEFEKFYREDILNFDYEIQETIRTRKWKGVLGVLGVVFTSGIILEIIGRYISNFVNFILSIKFPETDVGTILLTIGVAFILFSFVTRLITIRRIS